MKHDIHHIQHTAKPIDENIKQKIDELCETGLSPFQILSNVRCNFDNPIIYQDVYNRWMSVVTSRFKRTEEPRRSAEMYISDCPTLHMLVKQGNPYGLGFYTEIGREILENWRVEEVLIDSTFKTNKEKLELFSLIGSCMGTGFPLAYFLLQGGTGGALKSREESLTFFLNSVRSRFS